MSACLTSSEIEGLLDESLNAADQARALAHLLECERCRQTAARRRSGQSDIAASGSPDLETLVAGSDSERGIGDRPGSPGAEPIAGYAVLGEIHHGGQGVVYKAIQKSTRRVVALKVLRESPDASSRQRHRFEREIGLVAGLRHPGIVTLYESGVGGGRRYFAMEYVHGQPLDTYLWSRSADVADVLRLMIRVCEAVNYAHQRGVVHRDLKPSNILVDSEGQPRVLDFGLAKAPGRELLAGVAPATLTNEFMGTLAYASPEQTGSDPAAVDLRSDVYSLGVILYRLLTHLYPYDLSGGLVELLECKSREEPTKPSRHNDRLNADLDTVVLKALAPEREGRYQTAGALAEDLRRVLAGEPVEARRRQLLYVARRRAAALVRRQRVASLLAAAAVAALLTQFLFVPLFRWTGITQSIDKRIIIGLPPKPTANTLKHVRVVALTDKTPVEELANREGLSGVTVSTPKSLRRLHGRLMEKLARSGVRVVAYDINFPGETEFDQDLVRGARALREKGIPVIVTTGAWWLDAPKPHDLSAVIAPEVRWGCATGEFVAGGPWKLALVMRRGLADPLPSLALAAVAAFRHPEAEASLILENESASLNVAYWKSDPSLSQAKQWLPAADVINLAGVPIELRDRPPLGLRRGDRVGYIIVEVPSNAALEEATLEYGWVMSADQTELSTRLQDKLVLIGDCRPGIDRHPYPDGRTLSACYGIAAALDMLLATVSPGSARPRLGIASVVFAGAVLGVVAAGATRARPIARVILLTVFTTVLLAVTLVLAAEFRYLLNPVFPLTAAMLGLALAALADHVSRPVGQSR